MKTSASVNRLLIDLNRNTSSYLDNLNAILMIFSKWVHLCKYLCLLKRPHSRMSTECIPPRKPPLTHYPLPNPTHPTSNTTAPSLCQHHTPHPPHHHPHRFHPPRPTPPPIIHAPHHHHNTPGTSCA